MSTTDPTNPGGTQPGAGSQWPSDVAYGGAPDEHAGGGGVNPEAVQAGHEPDAFYVAPILSIPLAVVITFVVAFTAATIAFLYLTAPRTDPLAHPGAAKAADAGTNEQLARVERKGLDGNPDIKSDNARLEPLRQLEADGKTITRPPLAHGYNSPELHPEDVNPVLRPDKVPTLQTSEGGKLSIADAMAQATGEKRDAILPVRKDQVRPAPSDRRPSGANAGRGDVPPAPLQAAEPKKPEDKKPEEKKPEEKKPEEKKGPETPKK
ncbi:MAG TPA: hypothetical protein VKE74_16080 [Gemmataceae bacterium]|nr:hypothetical protein [Gemmataceae bacterium]